MQSARLSVPPLNPDYRAAVLGACHHWRAAGFPLMVYFLFLSRQEFILIRKDYLFSDRDSH